MVAVEEFTTGFRVQKSWSGLVALGLFFGGLGSGLFLVSPFTGFVGVGAVLGPLITLLGALFLFMHLQRPTAMWRAVLRPGTSWISRGVISITLFVAFAILLLLSRVPALAGLPWAEGRALGWVVLALAGIFAFLVMLYTGFILSTPPAITVWHTALVPILFSLYAFAGGIGAMFLWQGLVAGKGVGEGVHAFQTGLLVAILLCVVIYLLAMSTSTVAARESFRLLTSGEFCWPFLGGVIFVGLIVPAFVLGYTALAGVSLAPAALALIGVLELIGSFTFRYTFLRVGTYAPVV